MLDMSRGNQIIPPIPYCLVVNIFLSVLKQAIQVAQGVTIPVQCVARYLGALLLSAIGFCYSNLAWTNMFKDQQLQYLPVATAIQLLCY